MRAHACVFVCACRSVCERTGSEGERHTDLSRAAQTIIITKSGVGGRREAEPCWEPEQYARKLREGALGARKEPQAPPTPSSLREGL